MKFKISISFMVDHLKDHRHYSHHRSQPPCQRWGVDLLAVLFVPVDGLCDHLEALAHVARTQGVSPWNMGTRLLLHAGGRH